MKILKASVTDCFFDNKLSIHFCNDKTKSKLFASKFKINKKRYAL